MGMNLAQLGCLSEMFAYELRKRWPKQSDRISVEEQSGQGHLVPDGGRVYEVSFVRNVTDLCHPDGVRRWYNIRPSREGGQMVVYPHSSQAEVIVPATTLSRLAARGIESFRADNDALQEYLAAVSSGTQTGVNERDKLWVVDPVKFFASIVAVDEVAS